MSGISMAAVINGVVLTMCGLNVFMPKFWLMISLLSVGITLAKNYR